MPLSIAVCNPTPVVFPNCVKLNRKHKSSCERKDYYIVVRRVNSQQCLGHSPALHLLVQCFKIAVAGGPSWVHPKSSPHLGCQVRLSYKLGSLEVQQEDGWGVAYFVFPLSVLIAVFRIRSKENNYVGWNKWALWLQGAAHGEVARTISTLSWEAKC